MSFDELAALVARMDERTKHIADDVAAIKTATEKRGDDHESRIRALERWFWRVGAPVTGGGALAGFLAAALQWGHS